MSGDRDRTATQSSTDLSEQQSLSGSTAADGRLPPRSSAVDDEEESVFLKVLLIGEQKCGKTSFLRRYAENKFTTGYKFSIGMDVLEKTVRVNDTLTATLHFWDTAGQERFNAMQPTYYRGAAGAVVVFSWAVPGSFEQVLYWKKRVDTNVVQDNVPVFLVGNKLDLHGDAGAVVQKTDDELDEFCRVNGFVGWQYTSALTGAGIHEAVMGLLDAMLWPHGDAADDGAETAGAAAAAVPGSAPGSAASAADASAAASGEVGAPVAARPAAGGFRTGSKRSGEHRFQTVNRNPSASLSLESDRAPKGPSEGGKSSGCCGS